MRQPKQWLSMESISEVKVWRFDDLTTTNQHLGWWIRSSESQQEEPPCVSFSNRLKMGANFFSFPLNFAFFAAMDGAVVSTIVPDSPHKIFIGGLPNYLNEDQVCMSTWKHSSEARKGVIGFFSFLFLRWVGKRPVFQRGSDSSSISYSNLLDS